MHAATLVLGSRTELPATLVSGRFFYTPAVDGRRLKIWLDTDGSGFIAERTAVELALPLVGRQARLPSSVMQPTANDGLLPIFRPDPSDPIFEGIDAQVGATWFQGRIVCMEYPRARLSVLQSVPADAGSLGRATMSGSKFKVVQVGIAGTSYAMNFDTAATIALNEQTLTALHDGWAPVRATSFLRSDVMKRLHETHPRWPYVARAGADGIAMLRVPRVTIGTFIAQNVWFSTRPGDDVFEGETVAGKIGPTAFSQSSVTLDYPGGSAYFDP